MNRIRQKDKRIKQFQKLTKTEKKNHYGAEAGGVPRVGFEAFDFKSICNRQVEKTYLLSKL